MKINSSLIIALILFSINSYSQMFFSETLPKSFVGPKNIVSPEQDPSLYYINEIKKAIYTLEDYLTKRGVIIQNRLVSDSYSKTKFRIKNIGISTKKIEVEIERLDLLLNDWISYLESEIHRTASGSVKELSSFIVRELYVFKNEPPYATRKFVNRKSNCLSADPNDCLVWNLISDYGIEIEDSYGTSFNPNFHSMSNVKLDDKQRALIFTRVIEIPSSNSK